MEKGQVPQGAGSRLDQVQREIDAGLDRYLSAQGSERQALTLQLMRLRWEQEELMGPASKSAAQGVNGIAG